MGGRKKIEVPGTPEDWAVIYRKGQTSAKMAGHKYFFTGRPCLNGHVSVRYVANGKCFRCSKEANERRQEARKAEREAMALADKEAASSGFSGGFNSISGGFMQRPTKPPRKLPEKKPDLTTKQLAALPRSLEQARKEKAKLFFSGRKCPHGHIYAYYTNSNRCVKCMVLAAEKNRLKYAPAPTEQISQDGGGVDIVMARAWLFSRNKINLKAMRQ